MIRTLLLLFIITILLAAASFCYAGTGRIEVNVVPIAEVKFENIENPIQFIKSCVSSPASSPLCEGVIDMENIISKCLNNPNYDGLCENIVTGE